MKTVSLILLTLSLSLQAFEITDDIYRPKNIGDLEIDLSKAMESLSYPDLPGVDHQKLSSGEKSYFIPLELSKSDRFKILLASGAGIIIFKNDAEIKEFAEAHNTERTKIAADIGNFFAEGIPTALLGGGPYLFGVVMKDDEIKETGIIVLETAALSLIVTNAIKYAVDRVRPLNTDDPYQFEDGKDNTSFPSGHTTNAFSLATAISMTYGKNSYFIPIFAYGAATLTAFARIHDNMHWGSDVLFGGLIGHFVTKKYIENRTSAVSNGILITPVFTQNFSGVIFEYSERPKIKFRNCEAEFPNIDERVRVCLGAAFK